MTVFVVWFYTAEDLFIAVATTEPAAERCADLAAVDYNIDREEIRIEKLETLENAPYL